MKSKKNSKLRLSFKTKMLIVSIVLLTVPMLSLGAISFYKSSASLEELGADNIENSVEMTMEVVELFQASVAAGMVEAEAAQDDVKNLILGEMKEDGTRPFNDTIDLGDYGYIFIIDSEGELIAHPTNEGGNVWNDTDTTGKKFAQEFINVGQSGGGFSYYDYPHPTNSNQIEPKISYSQADEDWGWIIVGSTYMSDFNEAANDLSKMLIIVEVIFLVVGVIFIILFANSIAKPINALAQNLSTTGETLERQSEELNIATTEVQVGSDQISITMEEMAEGSEEHSRNLTELASVISNYATSVEVVSGNTEQLDEKSQDMLKLTREGVGLMNESTAQMDKIDKIVRASVEKIKSLDHQTQEISSLVTVIMSVAEQTNLLALNAAIEAARAGEHGQGFSVVADEVRKLAEKVQISVGDITELVSAIQNESATATEMLVDGYEEVEAGAEKIERTNRTFNSLGTDIEVTVDSIANIRDTLSDVAAASQQMSASMSEIASLSEQQSAGIEETSATIRQATNSTEGLARNSQQLTELAEEIKELIAHVKL